MLAKVYGVSLVWCSQLGLLARLLCLTAGHRGGLPCDKARAAGLLAGAAAVLYYALTFPAILQQFQLWLDSHGLGTRHTFALVTDGKYSEQGSHSKEKAWNFFY